MSIRYVIQQRKNPRDPAAGSKFYLISKTFAAVDRNFLIKDMVKNTSLTANEAATGIDYLFDSIPKFLSMGFTVQLGNLGYFNIIINSEGSDTKKEATVDKIKRRRLVFVAGKEIRKLINEMQVEDHDEKDKQSK